MRKRATPSPFSSSSSSSSFNEEGEEVTEGEDLMSTRSSTVSSQNSTASSQTVLYDSDDDQVSQVVSMATLSSRDTASPQEDTKETSPELVKNTNNNVTSQNNPPAHSYSADFVSSSHHHHHHPVERENSQKSQHRQERRTRRSMPAKCAALRRQDTSIKQAGKKRVAPARTSKSCTTECEVLRLNYKAPSPRQMSELMVGFCNLTSDWVSDASDDYDIILFDDDVDVNDEEDLEEDPSFARSQADSQSYHGDLELSLDDDAQTVSSKGEDPTCDITAMVSSLEIGDNAFSNTQSHMSDSKSNNTVIENPSRSTANLNQTSSKIKLQQSLESIEPRASFHCSSVGHLQGFGCSNTENFPDEVISPITPASSQNSILEAKRQTSRESFYSSHSTPIPASRHKASSSPRHLRDAIMRAMANGEFDNVSPVAEKEIDEFDGSSPVCIEDSCGVIHASDRECDDVSYVANGKLDEASRDSVPHFATKEVEEDISVSDETIDDATYVANRVSEEVSAINSEHFDEVTHVSNEGLESKTSVENSDTYGIIPAANGSFHAVPQIANWESNDVPRGDMGDFDDVTSNGYDDFHNVTPVTNDESNDVTQIANGESDDVTLNAKEDSDGVTSKANGKFDDVKAIADRNFVHNIPISAQGASENFLLHENQNSFPQHDTDGQVLSSTVSASVHNINLSETSSVALQRQKENSRSVRKGYSTSLLAEHSEMSRAGIKIDFMSEIVPLSPTAQVSLASPDMKDDKERHQERRLQRISHRENMNRFEEDSLNVGDEDEILEKENVDESKNVDLNFSGAQGAQYRFLPGSRLASNSADTGSSATTPAEDNTDEDDQGQEEKDSQTLETYEIEAEDGALSAEGDLDVDREFSNLDILEEKASCSKKITREERKAVETLCRVDKGVQRTDAKLLDLSKQLTSKIRLQALQGARRKRSAMKGKRPARLKRKEIAHGVPGAVGETKKSETQFLSLLLSMVESEHQAEEEEDFGKMDAENPALGKSDLVDKQARQTGPRFPRGIDSMSGASFPEQAMRGRRRYNRVTTRPLVDMSRRRLRNIKSPRARVRKGRRQAVFLGKTDPSVNTIGGISFPDSTRGMSTFRGSGGLSGSFGCHDDKDKRKHQSGRLEDENYEGLLLRSLLDSEHEIYAQTEDTVYICEEEGEVLQTRSCDDSYPEQHKLFRADGKDKFSALKEYYTKKAEPRIKQLQEVKSGFDPDAPSGQNEAERVSSYSRISKIKFQAPSIVKDDRLKNLSVGTPDGSGGHAIPRQMWNYPSVGGYRVDSRNDLHQNASLDAVGERMDTAGSLVTRSLQELSTASIVENISSGNYARQRRATYTDLLQANAMREINVMRKEREQIIRKKAQEILTKEHLKRQQQIEIEKQQQKKVIRARQAGVVVKKVKSSQDPWNSTVNEMLLKSHQAMERKLDSSSKNNRYPRPNSAHVVSPVPRKKFNFLSELLEQDKQDTACRLSSAYSPRPPGGRSPRPPKFLSPQSSGVVSPQPPSVQCSKSPSVSSPLMLSPKPPSVPKNQGRNALDFDQASRQTTPYLSDEDRNQNEKKRTKLPNIDKQKAAPDWSGRTLTMSGIMKLKTSTSPLCNQQELLSRVKSCKTPLGVSTSRRGRSPVRSMSTALQGQSTAPTRIKRRANFADQNERARITSSFRRSNTLGNDYTESIKPTPYRKREWKTAGDIKSSTARNNGASKTATGKREEQFNFGLSQHSDVFNYYTSPFLKDRENAVVQMY